MLPFFALACAPEPHAVVNDSAVDTGADAAVDSGIDSSDTSDTAGEATVAFDLTGNLNDLTFALVQLSVSDAGFSMGDVLLEQRASSRIELTPDPLPYVEPLPESPGLQGVFFVGGLHEDDGDGVWQTQERWFAAGSWMALYLSGDLPELYALAGLKLGWNSILINGAAIPTLGDPLALPLVNTWVEALALDGTADGSLPEGTRLALVPAPVFAGSPVNALLTDTLLTNPWAASASGAPDPSHLLDLDNDGFPEAVETFIAYADTDASGDLTAPDVGLGGVCTLEGAYANQGVGLYFSAPTPNVLWPVYSAVAGAALGWNAFAANPTSGKLSFLAEDSLAGLVASTVCAVE